MRHKLWLGLILGALATLGGVTALKWMTPDAVAAGSSAMSENRGGLIASFGVGGVLTRDGELWQYRPDRDKWMTLDESFALEGTATKLVPLPVPADQVKSMETFGFLVTTADVCWLYDLDRNEWKKIGAPPFQGQGR